MGGFKIYGHMTIKVYSWQHTGGGSSYPTVPYAVAFINKVL